MESITTPDLSTRFRRASDEVVRSARLVSELWVPAVRSPAGRAFTLHRLSQELCKAQGLRTVVHGRVPRSARIFVANHQSSLDPLLICSLVPALPIARRQLLDLPILGPGIARYGALFVEPGDAKSGAAVLRAAVRRLGCGASVLNFPEGAVSPGRPQQFQRGVFGLSKLVGIPVVPVCIRFDDPELARRGHAAWVANKWRSLTHSSQRLSQVHIHFGPPLHARAFRDSEEHAAVARDWIVEKLQSPLGGEFAYSA